MPSLEGGGAEKSLVTLIGSLDHKLYDIHLLLFEKKGVFLPLLSDDVKILEPIEVLGAFAKPFMKSIDTLQRTNRRLILKRMFHSFNNKFKKNKVGQLQKSWNLVSNMVEVQDGHYDAVIGYLEMWPIYFAVEKINARVKIGVIHTNYTKYGMDKDFDLAYFSELDYLMTVSEECRSSLIEEFPHIADKINIMENIISEKEIQLLADENEGFKDDFNGMRLLTIGRLDYNKGYDLAIEACSKLVEKGCNIRWYAMGTGPDKEKFMKMVKTAGLEGHFIFLGNISNPYPYLKQADIYVHPSRLEGKSMAVEEAKVLKKPIIVTAYENAKDQITHGQDGVIVEMDAAVLADGIEELIYYGHLRGSLVKHLSSRSFSNEQDVLGVFNKLINESLQPV